MSNKIEFVTINLDDVIEDIKDTLISKGYIGVYDEGDRGGYWVGGRREKKDGEYPSPRFTIEISPINVIGSLDVEEFDEDEWKESYKDFDEFLEKGF